MMDENSKDKLAEDYQTKASECFAKEEYDDAFSNMEKALTLVPDSHDFLHDIATICIPLGKFDEAIDFLKRAISLCPDYSNDYYLLGHIFSTVKGDHKHSLEFFKTAYALDKTNVDILQNIATIQEKLGEIGGAIQAYQEILNLNPADEATFSKLITLFNKNGCKSEAINFCREFIKNNPDEPTGYEHLCGYLVGRETNKERWAIAQKAQELKIIKIEKALNENPEKDDEIHLRMSLALTYQGAQLYDKAIECYKRVLELDETYMPSESFLGLSQCYGKLGDDEQSKYFWEKSQASKNDDDDSDDGSNYIAKVDFKF